MAKKATRIYVKIQELNSSTRLPQPFVFDRVVQKGCERLNLSVKEFVEKYRIYYIDNFDIETEIDNEEEFQMALSEISQFLELNIVRRQNEQYIKIKKSKITSIAQINKSIGSYKFTQKSHRSGAFASSSSNASHAPLARNPCQFPVHRLVTRQGNSRLTV